MHSLLESTDIALGAPLSGSASMVRFTSDGLLLFLHPNAAGVRTLFSYEPTTHTLLALLDRSLDAAVHSSALSLTEQLRRERMRSFASGISSFDMVESGAVFENRLMIPTADGRILIYDHRSSFLPKLWTVFDGAGSGSSPVDPHISAVGDKVAFVLENDLFFIHINEDAVSKEVHRVTTRGAEGGGLISCGVAEFIAQEEMDRYRGFWWSPLLPSAKQFLLYTVVDESRVPEFTILHQVKE